MTIASELNTLISTKSSIKSAIIAQGVSVSDDDTFASYAEKIAQISTQPNLQTKTLSSNGTYTPDSGYDGFSQVTVSVTPPVTNCPVLRVINCGCSISSDGIASNFTAIESGSNIGGLRFMDSVSSNGNNTLAKFLATKFPAKKNISFQLMFRTPSTAIGGQYIGQNFQGTWSNDAFHLYIPATFDAIKIITPTYQWKTASYSFATSTWYIVRYTQYYSSSWKIKTEISTDNGATWTTLQDESGRFDDDSNSLINKMKFDTCQIGYCAGYNNSTMESCSGQIDLKRTGFINNETNYSFMFAV